MAGAGAEPKEGSVPEIARWLLLWGSDPGGGFCRVELLDPEARKRVVERVRVGLAERDIALSELTLLRDREPEETALWLAGELRTLAPSVVSVSGFAAAFPSGPKLDRFLQALNYQREQLARPELRQIWWMEAHVGQEFTRQVPDLDSWFQIRLSLTEVVSRFEGPLPSWGNPPKVLMERPAADDVSPLEARALLAEAKARVEQAARRGELEKSARRTLDRALRELRQSGAGNEADAEERQLREKFPQLWGSGSADSSPSNDDPNIARAISSLAQVLQTANRLADAEPLLRQALAIDEANLGPDHPEVARGLDKLAALLRATNRFEEAEPLLRRALSIDEASLGIDHPTVAIRLNHLATLLRQTNRFEEAEPLLRRALSIDEASRGNSHPTVAASLNNLALLFQATNRQAEAEALLWRALSIDEASLGPDHPSVAIDLYHLADLLQQTNRQQEAITLLRRALAILERSLGGMHPSFVALRSLLEKLLLKAS